MGSILHCEKPGKTKPAWALALLLAIVLLSIFSSPASAQSACAAGTALTNQGNSQELAGDCDALLSARDTLVGTATLNWSDTLPIEEWQGVSVDADSSRVTGLNLGSVDLDGEIPPELGLLDALEELYLNANQLTGDIPSELAALEGLRWLYLNGNQFDGDIPAGLGGLTNLQVLSLSQNQLAGGIPSELGLLANLEELYLNGNQLSGGIPPELGNLSSLERLYLDRNQLNGMIPPNLGNLTSLRVLSLSKNQLTGEIPAALGSLTILQSLYLDGNRLTGEIPAALGTLASLERIILSGNQLTGCVPRGLIGAVVDDEPLDLLPCEAPATPGTLSVIIALDGPRAPVRLNTPIGLTVTFSEPVSDFAAEDIIVAFGTVANFGGSGANYTLDVMPTAAGPVTVDIPAAAATDTSGSGNTAADQLLLGIPYDDNNDATIGKNEAVAAIGDFFAQSISKAQTIGMIGLYFDSFQVSFRMANAGPDAEALESSTVTLDGTATTGPEGSISLFHWEQVITGSPMVSLSGTDTARPEFTLPELSSDQDFVFRLTVTYNDGETSQDEVTITGRPVPGVIVSDVSGNTASVGSTAEFYVRLQSRPSSGVLIPVSSSNPFEGLPEQSELLFTPENWHIAQAVVIRGQNPLVQGGVQNYEIILGSPLSSDPYYRGLELPNVEMKGIALELTAPVALYPLIVDIPATLEPRVSYTGSSLLSFSLAQSPPGMSIDFNLGTITWTPQESDEGQTFDVTVKVNDGALFSETSFAVTVILPEPIATEIQGNVLTITDPTTTLNGMIVTAMPAETEASTTLPTLEKAPTESVPLRSQSITPVSDVLVVRNSYDNPVELRFPVGQLDAGTSLNEVNLYAYTEVSEFEENIWSPLGLDRSLDSTGDGPVYVVTLDGLDGLAFFGHQSTSSAIPFGSTSSGAMPAIPVIPFHLAPSDKLDVTYPRLSDITCLAETLPDNSINQDLHTCTYALDAEVEITVENFGNGCRWAGAIDITLCAPLTDDDPLQNVTSCLDSSGETNPCATVEDLAGWVIVAQSAFEEHNLNLGYDKEITVRIEGMDALGYVSPFLENRRVLHITDDNTQRLRVIQGTVVHEYFHHAQGHDDTQISGMSLLIDQGTPAKWLTEGTATWFQDELFDTLQSYLYTELFGNRIMEAGLDGRPSRWWDPFLFWVDPDPNRRPYQRFSLFKLITQACNESFIDNFKNLLNAPSGDDTGIRSLVGLLQDPSCDFGGHLGEERRRSLEAAVAYYNYATQFKEDMTLLDSNEPQRGQDDAFHFITPSYLFVNSTTGLDLNWATFAIGKFELAGVSSIPPAGAYSFEIPEINSALPAGKVAELTVESDRELIVSMAGNNGYFIGENTSFPIGPDRDAHTWFSTAVHGRSYSYGDTAGDPACPTSRCLPEIFVTLVNPSLEHPVNIGEISFRVLDDIDVEPTITSHRTGDRVSDRVVTIAGTIPEEARGATRKVVVTANGIRTEKGLSANGSFAADVVVSLGDNKITAQGFEGTIPVTNEEVITIQGVRSSSTRPNALIPSRVVFVLLWDTGRTTRHSTGDSTDVDIYSTDKNGDTIWYRGRTKGPGNLDFDNTYGFGPEVVSYRETADDVYLNGTFDVDVHYYSGEPSTNFTLDVILNEAGAGIRRVYKYQSAIPLTVSNSSHAGPGDSGNSRFNDILSVSCNVERVCQVSRFDRSKLSLAGETSATTGRQPSAELSAKSAETQENEAMLFASAYQECMSELETALSKSGAVDWSCNSDGTKQWP